MLWLLCVIVPGCGLVARVSCETGEAPAKKCDCLDPTSPPEPYVLSYPVPDAAVPVSAGMIVAVPADLLASPLKNGRGPAGLGRSALVIGGTGKIRTGGRVVFLKVVAVTEAVVRRDGQVRAEGRPYDHATLGPLEDWLDAQAGPGVIDGIAERAVPDEEARQGAVPAAAVGGVHDPGARAVDPDAGRPARRRDHRRWPGTWPCCPGPGGGTRRRSGPAWTGARPSGRPRWRNCRAPCWLRRPASTRAGTASPSRSGRTGRWRCPRSTGPAAGSRHAGEPGRIRVRRHRR